MVDVKDAKRLSVNEANPPEFEADGGSSKIFLFHHPILSALLALPAMAGGLLLCYATSFTSLYIGGPLVVLTWAWMNGNEWYDSGSRERRFAHWLMGFILSLYILALLAFVILLVVGGLASLLGAGKKKQ